MGTTASQSLGTNLPRCPACQYDMAGLATPICPECGVDVIVEQRRREAARAGGLQRARKLISIDSLLVIAGLYASSRHALQPWRRYSLEDALSPGIAGFLVLAFVWLWQRRREVLAEGQPRYLVPYLALFAWVTWVELESRGPYQFDVDSVAGMATLGSIITVLAWLGTRHRASWVLLMILGSLVMLPGVALVIYNVSDMPGHEWSHFSDPRLGQMYDQYPLRWDEARRFGPIIVATGAALALAGIVLRTIQLFRQRHTQQSASRATMTRTPQTDAFWNAFKVATGVAHDNYVVVTFGAKPETRDKLAELTLHGPKRATTSLKRDFELPGADPFPKTGDMVVVVDGSNTPRCIYRVTRIDVVAFRDVDAAFAWDEGEGDRSLADWMEGHRRFFVYQAAEEGFEFHEGLEVVLERFEVVWPTRFNLR